MGYKSLDLFQNILVQKVDCLCISSSFVVLHGTDNHQNRSYLHPTRLVVPIIFTPGTYVDVEPERRMGRRDSERGKRYVSNADSREN
jgi:hypothetical protein